MLAKGFALWLMVTALMSASYDPRVSVFASMFFAVFITSTLF